MTVRIAFVGAGDMARQHMRHVVSIAGAEIVALCDLDTNAAENARDAVVAAASEQPGAEILRGAEIYNDVNRMLASSAPDGVYVCIPPSTHGQVEQTLIDAGVAMFVEKPVTLDLGLAVRIRDAIKSKGLIAASGYQSRYGSLVEFLVETIGSRRIGMTVCNRYTRLPSKPWYRKQALSGGQVVDMSTHQVDLMRAVVGEFTSVVSTAGRQLVCDSPDDVFDVQAVSALYANGAVGSFASNMVSAHGTPELLRGMHIFAEDMTVSILGHEGEDRLVKVVDESGRWEREFKDTSLRDQAVAFVNAVESSDSSFICSDCANGVRTLAVTLAMHESAVTGTAVSVDEFMSRSTNSSVSGGELVS